MLFYVVVGTYSNVLYGYEVSSSSPNAEEPKKIEWNSKLVFVHPAHTACIRSLASADDLLVSGSDDETMKIYNLEKRVEVGVLMQHEGTVSNVLFLTPPEDLEEHHNQTSGGNSRHRSKWMISSGADGRGVVWRVKDWRPLLSLPACKPPFSPLIAVHPSGRALLTLGPKGELKLWNMMKGRSEFKRKLPKTGRTKPFFGTDPSKRETPLAIHWSPSGTTYTVLYSSHAAVFSADQGELSCKVEEADPLMCCLYIDDDTIVLGTQKGGLAVYDLMSNSTILTVNAHTNRVKGLSTIAIEDPAMSSNKSDSSSPLPLLISTSSDGSVKIWNMNHLLQENASSDGSLHLLPVCSFNPDDRITCLCASVARPVIKEKETTGKRKKEREEIEFETVEESEEPLKKRKKTKKQKKKEEVTPKGARVHIIVEENEAEQFDDSVPGAKKVSTQQGKQTNKQIGAKSRKKKSTQIAVGKRKSSRKTE